MTAFRASRPRIYGLYIGDLDRTSNSSHGIINYSLALATGLSQTLDPRERLVVYANPAIATELELDPRRSRIHLVSRPRNAVHRLVLDSRSAWLARRHGVDVLHYPKGILPLGLPPSRSRPALITTIHDDIPMRYAAEARIERGNLRTAARFKFISFLFMRSLRRSDCVITISASSRAALLAQLHDGAGADAPAQPIEVVPIAPALREPEFVPISGRPARVLHIASPFAHKGSAFAVESMRRYMDERAPDLRLVLVGRLPEGMTVDDPRIEHRTDPVTNADMARLMSTSRALVFVSSIEGYGLPPVEAWMYGTPCVYDSAPSLEEMPEEIPGQLREWTYDAFADALDTVLGLDDDELLRLRESVSVRLNTTRVSTQMLDIYRAHARGDRPDTSGAAADQLS